MPNWCYNTMQLEPKNDTQEAKTEFDTLVELIGDKFDFNKFIPMPKVLEGTITPRDFPTYEVMVDGKRKERRATPEELKEMHEIGYFNWYDWKLNNWGTKWFPTEVVIDSGEDWLVIKFDTAWCEPRPIFEHIRANYPNVEINACGRYEDSWDYTF